MSTYDQMRSHGPFKIKFKRAPWFEQFHEVLYVQREHWQSRIFQFWDGKQITEEEYEKLEKKLHEQLGPDCSRVLKNWMFASEFEWWSREPVRFEESDIVSVAFMSNAPCVVGPRILRRIRTELYQLPKYEEIVVHDEHY